MKPPAFEICLILPAEDMGWEYVARKQGEVIAASDGDANFENVGPAFAACITEINAIFSARNRGNGK